jgi:hypothetical protein
VIALKALAGSAKRALHAFLLKADDPPARKERD